LESPFNFFLQFAIQAPLLLVWIAGIVLAVLHWQRYPKIALATSIACTLFILDALVGTFISLWLPSFLVEQGQSATQIGTAFAFVGSIRSLLHALLWAAVLFAIFSGRMRAAAGTG
jgi:hypothetical protein